MAGTLITSTIQGTTLTDGTNSTSATNCIQGSAKAWVNFTGSSGTINGSYNISSVTLNSTGKYTITMTTAMPNVNYAISLGNVEFGTSNFQIMSVRSDVTITTTVFGIATYSQTTPQNLTSVYASVFSS